MSVIISGIKIDLDVPDSVAFNEICKKYSFQKDTKMYIYKKSIDARRGQIKKVLSVSLDIENEQEFVEKENSPHIKIKNKYVEFEPSGKEQMNVRPIIIGFGPSGLFAGYELAKNGYRPIILERGSCIKDRDKDVYDFLEKGIFNKNSNVQFGEGGAGSYSDGKLTTRINDTRCDYILNVLYENGAPEEILYLSKPHIGTDVLKNVVISIREKIKAFGGEVHFSSNVTDFEIKDGKITEIEVNGNKMKAETVILAVGHSARDTFYKLYEKDVFIEPKSFAIGARIEHLQDDINKSLYGKHYNNPNIPIGEYTLSHTHNGVGNYTFCMCPGGVVVPSNSEENMVVTNGMSYHARAGKNANSAVVVSVNPSDFSGNSPLAGIEFQRQIEQKAFDIAGKNYKAPVSLVSDFLKDKQSTNFGAVKPTYEIGTAFCKLTDVLPQKITDNMKNSLRLFSSKIKTFDDKSAILTAPETRTSSPVRITRNEKFESINIKGLYPCGEGAGYAGGIISASVDGLKSAEKIMEKYKGD